MYNGRRQQPLASCIWEHCLYVLFHFIVLRIIISLFLMMQTKLNLLYVGRIHEIENYTNNTTRRFQVSTIGVVYAYASSPWRRRA
jgi:hypothetical protein